MKFLISFVCLMLVAGAASAESSRDALAAMLKTIAHGKDAEFGQGVAPALSSDVSQPAAARMDAVIDRIAAEIDKVAQTFATAPAGDRIARTRAAVAGYDAETAELGASRRFEGDGPYLSLMRQLLFVPTAAAGAEPADRILGIISNFEHQPRTADSYYEYADATDLGHGAIMTLVPAPVGREAAAAMIPGRLYALKKCRHIPLLGWYCNTSRYAVRRLPGDDSARLLVTLLAPLAPGADNPAFRDARGQNIVEGYTAVYFILALPDMTLIYNLGIQSRREALRMQDTLDREHRRESRALAQTLKAALRLDRLPWEPIDANALTSAPGGYTGIKNR